MGKKFSFRNTSISAKINMYTLALLAVLIAALWLMQVVFFDDIYNIVKRFEAKNVAETAAEVMNGSLPAEKLVEEVAKKEVCLIVFDNDFHQVQSLDGPRDCVIHKMSQEERVNLAKDIVNNENTRWFLDYEQIEETYRLVTDSEEDDFRLFKEKSTLTSMVYVNQIPDGNGGYYVILVNAEAIPFDSVLNTTRTVLTFTSVLMILIASMLNLFISRSLSKPIQQINKKAKVLASGNYDIDFRLDSYKEINELSQTMSNTARELSNLEKLRQEFVANVSHDLRTPLTMIGGYAEVMRDIPGENSAENAQVIIDEAKRLNKMVTDLLNIAKIQSGTAKLDKTQYSITDSIRNITQNTAELLKNDGYEINFEYTEDVVVFADKTLIDQSFYNLLANAVSHNAGSKRIDVRQQTEGNVVKVMVTDYGKGISPEILPYIWQRYSKSGKSSNKEINSSGLGLSIVKTFVDAHGGECGVQSEEGRGSTFWFSISRE